MGLVEIMTPDHLDTWKDVGRLCVHKQRRRTVRQPLDSVEHGGRSMAYDGTGQDRCCRSKPTISPVEREHAIRPEGIATPPARP